MFDMIVPWWEFVVRGIAIYLFLLILLRVTGKRQIGQMSPFDLVLLLILANAVQNSMNAGDNSLSGGIISATTLVALNYLIGLATYKSKRMERLVEGRAQIVVHESKVFEDVMKEASITRHELDSMLRESGFFELKEVRLAVLENNGKISVQGYEQNPQKPA